MKLHDVPWVLLAALCYSGPLVPLSTPLWFKHASPARFRWNRSLFFWLVGLQALLFVPFVVVAAAAKSEAEADHNYWLFLPFVWGELTLVASTVYAVVECVRLSRLSPPS